MQFYTYNDWLMHAYSTTNEKEIIKGQSKIIDLTGRIGDADDQVKRLNIKSTFNPTVSVKSTAVNPVIDFASSNVDCNLGCLYKFKGDWSGPYPSVYKNSGCIQVLNNALGSQWQDAYNYPYIRLILPDRSMWPAYFKNELLTINIEKGYFELFDKFLIFQSIYSGCISYQEAVTGLEFHFDKMPGEVGWNYNSYDYQINTNLYSATSLMIVGALITFNTSGSGSDKRYLVTIQNVSKFVYGHVDMCEQFGWNILWKSFQPSKDAKYMPDSIMHYSRI